MRRYVLLVAWAVFLTLLAVSMAGRLPTAGDPPRPSDVIVVEGEQEARHG